MAIAVLVSPANLTSSLYDSVQNKLKQSGVFPPEGMLAHVCFGDENHLQVFSVWENKESFERFAQHLRPLAKEAGVEVSGTPNSKPVHNFVLGHAPVKS